MIFASTPDEKLLKCWIWNGGTNFSGYEGTTCSEVQEGSYIPDPEDLVIKPGTRDDEDDPDNIRGDGDGDSGSNGGKSHWLKVKVYW
jgi:hypothetical protein